MYGDAKAARVSRPDIHLCMCKNSHALACHLYDMTSKIESLITVVFYFFYLKKNVFYESCIRNQFCTLVEILKAEGCIISIVKLSVLLSYYVVCKKIKQKRKDVLLSLKNGNKNSPFQRL